MARENLWLDTNQMPGVHGPEQNQLELVWSNEAEPDQFQIVNQPI